MHIINFLLINTILLINDLKKSIIHIFKKVIP